MTNANTSFQIILEATEELIREKGCRQTTLQDIISETGLSKGAIYHYVSGKDELFGLLMKSRIEQVNARFKAVVSDQHASGLRNPLQLIAEAMVQTSHHADVTNKIFIYLLSQMDNTKVSAIVQGVYYYTLETCIRWICEGQEAGVIPAQADNRKIATAMLSFMYGLRVQHTIRQDIGSMTAEEIIQLMSRALQ
ncbi:TetR/AcrR family transcriptional regulator [Paenibacillus sp. N3.4]|uniref:TetR/AcrR family transcriptional regulator n=1 Tax=Paenibacillus sp. N3.4 TaxID=2603222 RepID=UPI0011C80217|nr:TetR/AcrR family transcriptional regulator [Paenibacillus sp. N3.4]TXK84456.1 TetR/AcrR family transcriptional regulator [Paenibacillus sp. N3.4]